VDKAEVTVAAVVEEEDSTTLVADSLMAVVNPDMTTSSRAVVVAVGNHCSFRFPTRPQLARPEMNRQKIAGQHENGLMDSDKGKECVDRHGLVWHQDSHVGMPLAYLTRTLHCQTRLDCLIF